MSGAESRRCSAACLAFAARNGQEATGLWLAFRRCVLIALVCSGVLAGNAWSQARLGNDIPFRWYEDPSGALGIEQFSSLPNTALVASERVFSLGYTRSALWLTFSVPASLFNGADLWLQLGPTFLDSLTLYYRPLGSDQPWAMKHTGDRSTTPLGDLDYRFPIVVLPASSPTAGYELAVRVQSSSALLLEASVWTPTAFLGHATRQSAFWGFYFGLAALCSLLALLAAFMLRRRLAWALCAFSLTYGLVACVQGYVTWLLGPGAAFVQHHLTGVLTLLAYTSLLWVTTEALQLHERRPGMHRLMLLAICLGLLLLLSIPFDFYGLAVEVQGVLCVATAVLLAVGAWDLWRNDSAGPMTLVLGAMPLLYVGAALLALGSLFGLLPYEPRIYGFWQYVVMVNMVTVLLWVAYRIRQEAREAQQRQALARALEAEREASFLQRQFIAMVSHEFRTPLAVIANALENLQLPSLNDVQRRRRYRNMRRAAERLVQLTDNCLADSRLDAGGIQVQLATADILALIRSATDVVDRSDVHRWSLQVNGESVSHLDASSLMVSMDAAMLRIALSNLLDNAVKYSSGGKVDIHVLTTDDGLAIRIRDRGCGIAPEDATRVFERYRRGANAAGKVSPGGTGLGLHVARQIIQAHGGALRLLWSSEDGSCFEMTLPKQSVGAKA